MRFAPIVLSLATAASFFTQATVEAGLIEENFDTYTIGPDFFDTDANGNYFFVTEDATAGGNRVARVGEALGTIGSIEVFSLSPTSQAIRFSSGTGVTNSADPPGFVMAFDLPGFKDPKGGALATPHDMLDHMFGVTMRQTAGPGVAFRWSALDAVGHEVTTTSMFDLTSSFQDFTATPLDFTVDPMFDVTQVANVGFDFFLQSGTNGGVPTGVVVELDNLFASPIPEPSTCVLAAMAAVGLILFRWRRVMAAD